MAGSTLGGIYIIRNLTNNKIYIGSTYCFRKRWYDHKSRLNNNKHSSKHLQHSWNKYGKENFEFEIVSYIEDETKLLQYEQKWLDFFKPEYNSCPIAGNTRGRVVSEETRAKLKARRHTEESKQKMRRGTSWNKGLKTGPLSEEDKLKKSLAAKKRWANYKQNKTN